MKNEEYLKQKEIFLDQTKNYLMALADTGAAPALMYAVLQIRDRAATANKREWKKEEYWEWWQEARPEVYAQ